METDDTCRLLTADDVEEAARVIAEAFVDDPLYAYMLPIRRTRTKTLTKFFRALGELGIRAGRGFGTGRPLQAVAYWIPPDKPETSISIRQLGVFIPLLFSFYPIGYLRAKGALEEQEALHRKYTDAPHYYLDNIGVLPSARGRGLSSKLIRPFLEKADAQKVMVYTDTFTRSNVALYEHFGFECVEERNTPVGLTIWALRRPVQISGQ